MSQETNLNVAPYFDDFDPKKDYYKVLFKPGYPVQARELTSLQSILQNQVEKFGQHFFKEGAKVIPGNTTYSTNYHCILLENSYLGIPLADYIDQLVGAEITGQDSGVSAYVDNYILSSESTRNQVTLYINYSGSGTDNQESVFRDGELLSADLTISTANTLISDGTPFASTILQDSRAIGSAFFVREGVYFGKGTFLNVSEQKLILDQYTNTPSYRIGLEIEETIVNSDLDPLLTDNSAGFNNFGAPGADRLKIVTSLVKKELTDTDDDNFVEIASTINGALKEKQTSDYSRITDELARRTHAESGDFYVKSFGIDVLESLDDDEGNKGLFKEDQTTYGGLVPSDDLGVYQISPGRAFVNGYDIETTAPVFLDFEKPRTTKTLKSQQINYKTGETVKLNRVYGSPSIGIGNTYVLSLRDSRVGLNSTTAAGKEIGLARVYDFRLNSGSYDPSNADTNEWGLSLYDVQTTTEITVNEPITLTVPTFIKGKNSGATAFLKDAADNTTSLVVYETSGKFIKNENFIIDGIENPRVAVAVTAYGIGDVLSVFGSSNGTEVGAAKTFSADVILSPNFNVGVATITAASSSFTSVIRSTNKKFPGQIKPGNILSFTGTLSQDPIFASVVSVASSSVTITGVTTVNGVASGAIPTAESTISDLKVIASNLVTNDDDTLYTEMPKRYISNVDLTNATLTIRKTQQVNIVDNKLSASVISESNESFLPFTPQRYTLIRSDGTTEELTSDKIKITSGSTKLDIVNLGNDDEATLVTTLTKIKPKSKNKIKNRVNSIIVDKSIKKASGIGSTTLNDGLTYGNYPYGTRVQDENISLNYSDVCEVHGIYELATDPSANNTDPSAPSMILQNLSGVTSKTSDLVIGELVIGETSGAHAIVAVKETDSKIVYLPKNQTSFKEGETVIFKESGIRGSIVTLNTPSKNISFKFEYSNGQNGEFYNYGVLTRKNGEEAPQRRFIVYLSNGYYESTDDGDITTANSYSNFDYTYDIQDVNDIRNTDILDIRPKVSDIETISEGDRSPLEFKGRLFNVTGNSAPNILASNEGILTDFSFYLGRIDKIYLSSEGIFQVKFGTPAEKPQQPNSVDDSLEIGSISLPPYLFDVSNASVKFLDYKRFRMADIKRLEDRVRNLEFFTSLSLLETNTANLFVPDANGLNRFKSGFFVDNFTTKLTQEKLDDEKNSQSKGELHSSQYARNISFILNNTETEDLQFSAPEGTNIKKSGDIVTLDYTDVEYEKQSLCTRSESVTPFIFNFWRGTITLTPESDNWTSTKELQPKNVGESTNETYEEVLERAKTLNIDESGYSPKIWNDWVENWTGSEEVFDGYGTTVYESHFNQRRTRRIDTSYRPKLGRTRDFGTKTRDGIQYQLVKESDSESQGKKVVSKDKSSYARSRNIEFRIKDLKPNTQFYGFFDSRNITKYCIPKLLEIKMTSGTFQVGETVTGSMRSVGDTPASPADASITFRVAQANHKVGKFNIATEVFEKNPYNSSQTLPASYSSTSTILNVDTFSLSNEPQGTFTGFVASEMKLVGKTSKAEAVISQVRLVSDSSTDLIGSFFIPDHAIDTNPKFETGDKEIRFIDNENNSTNSSFTHATATFSISGIIENTQDSVVSVRKAYIREIKIPPQTEKLERFGAQRVIGTSAVSDTMTVSEFKGHATLGGAINPRLKALQDAGRITTQEKLEDSNRFLHYDDPIAETFLVSNELAPNGIFFSKVDIFFETKDDKNLPITFELRTTRNGVPTTTVLPLSTTSLKPDQVNTSDDGSAVTTFVLPSPVYLKSNTEYAMVLRSASTKYKAFISRVGEKDKVTQSSISSPPYYGSFFKSQNGVTWEPSQLDDLKFTIYRADFETSGSMEVYSPELSLGNKQIAKLLPNSISLSSRSVRIGIGSTLQDEVLTLGNTVLQSGNNASGNYIGNAGIATGSLNIINAGIGFTPNSGSLTYNAVDLTNITSSGRNAKADITVTNGQVTAATISEFSASSGGQGYVVGDVLGVSTIGNNNLGRNLRLSLVSIANTNEIILDNVQGDFITGVGHSLQFVKNNGITTALNYATGGNVLIDGINNIISDGVHFTVNHKHHGMNFADNRVIISDVESDILPIKLSANLDSTSTSTISVDSTTGFDKFENVGVGTTNLGYLRIGEEIISYDSASGNSISISQRGVDSTTSNTYLAGSKVFKYELGGVSLRRINKTHNLNDVTASSPRTLDTYKVKLDMGSSGIGRSSSESFPILYMNETKSAGGSIIKATHNVQFEDLTPQIEYKSIAGTDIDAELRTITGSSISGNEIPYIDQGFEPISISKQNFFSTPRIIASKVNEDAKLTNLPGNKSMTLRLNLSTIDSRVSPIIDTQRMSVILSSNRVNSEIGNYITDNRVNGMNSDPTAFQYLSKEILLENPATSLKIIVDVYKDLDSDIRGFFAISDNQNFNPIYQAFPGFNNIDQRGRIIDIADNDGLSDVFVSPSKDFRDFKEHVFTIDELPSFKSYRIKLLLTSTNQANPPIIKNLRAIALA